MFLGMQHNKILLDVYLTKLDLPFLKFYLLILNKFNRINSFLLEKRYNFRIKRGYNSFYTIILIYSQKNVLSTILDSLIVGRYNSRRKKKKETLDLLKNFCSMILMSLEST